MCRVNIVSLSKIQLHSASTSSVSHLDVFFQPQLNLLRRGATNYIYPHTGAAFEIRLRVPPGTTYSPLILNITTPSLNGKPLLSICRVAIQDIGKNFYCYGGNRTEINGYSMAGDGPIDQYVIDLQTVSNTLTDVMEEGIHTL